MKKLSPVLLAISIILFALALMEILVSINLVNDNVNNLIERQDRTDRIVNDLIDKYSIMDNVIIIATKSAETNL